MNKIIIIITLLLMLLITGCSDDPISESTCGDVVTTNIGENDYYFNLIEDSDTTVDQTWHFAFGMLDVDFGGNVYQMPNFWLGNGVYVAIYNDINYDDINIIPETFMQDVLQDNNSVQYDGDNEVISYDMNTHVVSISTSIFVIYENTSHTTYKVEFLEYDNEVICFNYSQL